MSMEGAARIQRAPSRRAAVVEDNPDAAFALVTFLRAYGADAYEVDDYLHAVDLLAEQNPAMLFLDIELPQVSGFFIAASLRERGYAGRIIAVSGRSEEEVRALCLSRGFDEFWLKPVDPDRLKACAEELAR